MFHNDLYKMVDFISYNKEDFINLYPYITGLEYDLTHDYFYSDIVLNCIKLYENIDKSNLSIKEFAKLKVKEFINKLPKVKRDKINIYLTNLNKSIDF